MERVPTGIDGLDEVIEGGFQTGSLILLAGNPGTGKTVLASTFLCKGTELGEAGVYVSFAEDKQTFTHNMSRHLGTTWDRCFKSGKLNILDFVTVKEEGVSATLELILAEVRKSRS